MNTKQPGWLCYFVCLRRCIWRPEVNLGWHPQEPSTSCFEAGSPPGSVHPPTKLAGLLLPPPPQFRDYNLAMWLPGIKLSSPTLLGRLPSCCPVFHPKRRRRSELHESLIQLSALCTEKAPTVLALGSLEPHSKSQASLGHWPIPCLKTKRPPQLGVHL